MSAQAKGKLSLSIDLKNLGGGAGGAKLAPKPIINLAPAKAKRQVQMKYIAITLLTLVLLAVGYKFLIVDQQARLTAARQSVEEVRTQRDEAQARLDELELNDIEGEFYHLTYDGMSEDELNVVDRIEVMDMLERVVDIDSTSTSWVLSDNTLSMSIDAITLEEVNQTVQRFLAEDIVLYCTVTTAARSDSEGAEGEDEDVVVADIMVYLSLPVEEEPEPESVGLVVVTEEELREMEGAGE